MFLGEILRQKIVKKKRRKRKKKQCSQELVAGSPTPMAACRRRRVPSSSARRSARDRRLPSRARAALLLHPALPTRSSARELAAGRPAAPPRAAGPQLRPGVASSPFPGVLVLCPGSSFVAQGRRPQARPCSGRGRPCSFLVAPPSPVPDPCSPSALAGRAQAPPSPWPPALGHALDLEEVIERGNRKMDSHVSAEEIRSGVVGPTGRTGARGRAL